MCTALLTILQTEDHEVSSANDSCSKNKNCEEKVTTIYDKGLKLILELILPVNGKGEGKTSN